MSTKLKNKVIVLLSWALLLQLDHFALAADITKEEDLLTVCPGELVSLTCTHNDVAGGLTRWQVSGPMSCIRVIAHDAELQEDVCGPFTITMISDNSGSTLSSTIQIPATEALNSTVVTCLAGGSATSPQAGNTTLNVINITSLTNWMANLRTNSLCPVLEWDPVGQPYQKCVTGYTINLNGTVYNTTNTSLSLAGERLSYYETQTVTVRPLTLNGLLSPDTSNITVINPDSRTPALSTSFIIKNEALKLQIVFQEISIDIAPIRMFGYIMSGENCVPTTSFNGSSVVIDFSDQSPGDVYIYTVCVMFRNKDCSAINSTTVTVPATIITVQEETPSDTSYRVRLSLPFTGYPPSDLLIVSTLSPPHSDPITLPTTNQVTVTFTELTAGVDYTYTIRVVLASNQSNDVVSPVTGEFSLTTLGGGGGGESTLPVAVVAGAIMGGIAVLLFFIIIVTIVIVITRRRTSDLYSKEIAHQETPCVIEESDYAVPQDLKYMGSRLSNVHLGDNFLQCKSPTTKSTSPNISDEGIYSLVFDALPNGTSQTVVSGKSNVL